MLNFEEISFNIISQTGEAKYMATEAFKLAKNGKYDESFKKIDEAYIFINKAGSFHMDVITEEANGKDVKFSVLFMHAEDQFLSTQTFILQTKMLIEVMQINEK